MSIGERDGQSSHADDTVERAHSCIAAADWHSERDQKDEALAYSYEAVAILRRIVAAGANGEYHADLAAALVHLSQRFADRERWAEAMTHATEAVSLWRGLVGGGALAHQTDLASALVNVSRRLRDLERWSEALAPAEEAVWILRQLVAGHDSSI